MFTCAVIGLGNIGLMYDFDIKRSAPSSHVLAFEQNTNFNLVAASDTRLEQEVYLHKLVPDTKFYENFQEMLTLHSVDVISLCTHADTRVELLDYIVRNSKAKLIFCEKPVAANVRDCKVISELLNLFPGKFIPNLSRRWNTGVLNARHAISEGKYGAIQKIHIRYTRGIYNTGSHIFDLIKFLVGEITSVRVLHKTFTSSEKSGELSFTFEFTCQESVQGFAEAFNDSHYYMFEVDLYFDAGKIEITQSGDLIKYLMVDDHPLFSGFKSLVIEKVEQNLLSESTLKRAVEHLDNVLRDVEQPVCTYIDGIYPLFIAEALLKSYYNHGSKEKVVMNFE